jgi:hypothetical protein
MTTPNPAAAVFYTLPTEDLEVGMSTADGQDILAIHHPSDDLVIYEVYTPADDPDENDARQGSPESRAIPVGHRVELAVFPDTEVDGSTHEQAIVTAG